MTSTHTAPLSLGLAGVLVAETHLSSVNGAEGRLILRGHSIEALGGHHPFEAVAHLLLKGSLPGPRALKSFTQELAEARAAAFSQLPELSHALENASAMGALRGALGQLSAPDGGGDALGVIGAAAVVAAAWVRGRQGLEAIAPDPNLGHGANYLYMATGVRDAARGAAIDAYLCTVMDHGLNASTFTARVIASTGSDLVSSVCGAIGALKGPLHGGAPGPVLDMLDAVGTPENASRWIEGELGAGRRIMGMGHRVYRVRDPRAAVLEAQLRVLMAEGEGRGQGRGGGEGRLALAKAVEEAAEDALKARYPARPLKANVEFFTAVLLEAAGLPREAFASTFAVGRVVGWCAHVAEEREVRKLIRPLSRYVGPMPA